MIAPGTILQERYRVVRQLGQGGMGAVYEALDERLHRVVALKETLVEGEELRRAFAREARLLANLNHPALPKVIDHFSEGAGQYLVMEFIPGADLAQLLAERGRPYPFETVLRWADELLDALEYLHGLDPPIIHRDIKPANLKLTAKERIILLDFGLAKGAAGQMTKVQASQSILGYTPNYAALEQIQGERTGPRSDLYSLAATLYNLLTGHNPIDALKRATEALHDEADPLRPPHELNPDVPVAVSNVLMRALALRPSLRPASAADLRAALTQARTGLPAPTTQADDEATRVRLPPTLINADTAQASERDTMLLPSRPKTDATQASSPATADVAPRAAETVTVVAPRTRTRRRLPTYALAALLAVLVAAGGLFALQMFSDAQRQPQPSPAPQQAAQPDAQPAPNPQPAPQQAAQPSASPTAAASPTATARTAAEESAAKERARLAAEQRAEQQRAEEERRAAEEEQRAAADEAARERAEAGRPQFDAREFQTVRAETERLRAQFRQTENEYRQARLALTNAQRNLRREQDLLRAGHGSSEAVNAAAEQVNQAASALGPAQMKYQIERGVLREMEKRLERLGSGPQTQLRPRRTIVLPPVPPRVP